MEAEYNSIIKHDTCKIVDRPLNRKLIGTKWIWRVKYKVFGTSEKYKARLVAQACSQVEGFDVSKTFAPTDRMSTIRLVLGLAARRGWKEFQMDVKSAFLNGEIKEEFYVA